MSLRFSERELRRLGDKDLAQIQHGLHAAFKERHPELGDIALPVRPQKKNTKQPESIVIPSMELVVSKHVERYIGLGFYREVYPNLDDEEATARYREDFALPVSGVEQPEAHRGRFDVYLVVDPRINLPRQHKRAKIAEYIDTGKITNLTQFPRRPYVVFTHDANRYRPHTVDQAIAKFAGDEVGSPQVEVTALYLNYPQFFRDHGVDAAGSRYKSDYVPCLYTFHGRPEVGAYWSGDVSRYWGALSRGKEIIELGA